YRSPVTFEAAGRDWANQRFNLTGNTVNALRITFRQAQITERLLPVDTGISGAFKKEQAAEYEAVLDVSLEIVDANGKVVASATGAGTNKHTASEDATEYDKQMIWVDMVKRAFDSLDRELIPQMRRGMATTCAERGRLRFVEVGQKLAARRRVLTKSAK
ncbi:MAG: hypothetical protein RLN70_12460, partial [Rhodospirillaceae bacterium]